MRAGLPARVMAEERSRLGSVAAAPVRRDGFSGAAVLMLAVAMGLAACSPPSAVSRPSPAEGAAAHVPPDALTFQYFPDLKSVASGWYARQIVTSKLAVAQEAEAFCREHLLAGQHAAKPDAVKNPWEEEAYAALGRAVPGEAFLAAVLPQSAEQPFPDLRLGGRGEIGPAWRQAFGSEVSWGEEAGIWKAARAEAPDLWMITRGGWTLAGTGRLPAGEGPSLAKKPDFVEALRPQPAGMNLFFFTSAEAAKTWAGLRGEKPDFTDTLYVAAGWSPGVDDARTGDEHDFVVAELAPGVAEIMGTLVRPLEGGTWRLAGADTLAYTAWSWEPADWATVLGKLEALGGRKIAVPLARAGQTLEAALPDGVTPEMFWASLDGEAAHVVDWPEGAALPFGAFWFPAGNPDWIAGALHMAAAPESDLEVRPVDAETWVLRPRAVPAWEFHLGLEEAGCWLAFSAEGLAYFRQRAPSEPMERRAAFRRLLGYAREVPRPFLLSAIDARSLLGRWEDVIRQRWPELVPWLRRRGLTVPDKLPEHRFSARYGNGILTAGLDGTRLTFLAESEHAGITGVIGYAAMLSIQVWWPEWQALLGLTEPIPTPHPKTP